MTAQAGLFGPAIAYNEHRTAPALSALGRVADDTVRRANRNAAKARRRAGAPPGPAQPASQAPRTRTLVRVLKRDGRKAFRNGDLRKAEACARALGKLLQARGAL